MRVEVVCWDWNGTLLDDVERCLRIMNQTLRAFGKAEIADAAAYRSIFRFPLQDFYADAGISAAEFPSAAAHYLELLANDDADVPLHSNALQTIEALRQRGIRQILASATETSLLHTQLHPHGLADEFETVLGIPDGMRASKRDVIANWLEHDGLNPSAMLMIGDSNHDQEIADELGAHFVHFTDGHQDLVVSPDVPQINHLGDLVTLVDRCRRALLRNSAP